MLTALKLREKVQYRHLMALTKSSGYITMDLRVQRFKAVSRGKCLGYYSSLALACATVDGGMTNPPKAELLWSESGVAFSRDYVLDVQRNVYYTRKLKHPYSDGLKVTGAAA